MRKTVVRVSVGLAAMVAVFVTGTVQGSTGRHAGMPTGTGTANAPAVTGNCVIKKAPFAAADNTGLSTTSTSYVDVPDMSVTFTVGGTAAQCLIVDFSAWAFAPGGSDELMMVRALLDGAVVSIPSEVQFVGDSNTWADQHSVLFSFTGVAPGSHTVKIQFRSFFGGSVFMHRRMVAVYHGK